MVRKFEEGKKYKFSKEQFFSHELDQDREWYENSWVQRCDGKEVVIYNSYDGDVEGYLMTPEWCVEVGSEDDDAYRISREIHYALNYAIHKLNEKPNMVFMTRDIFMICQREASFEFWDIKYETPRYTIFGYPIKVIDGENEIYVGHVGEVII